MSNLKDLYISQSYFGIVNLEDSTQPLVSQSGDINLQDGSGDNLGLKINATTNKFTIVNDLQVDGNADFNGDIDVSGSWVHTGSIDVVGNVTVEGNLTAHTGSFDTINARVLHVTVESSSVILSSGSNQLGDDLTDTQVLSGSVYIPNVEYLAGNPVDTDTRINNLNESSASQQTSIDLLNSFTSSYYVDSASFDTRINNKLESSWTSSVFLPFSTSVDSRLDDLEAFSSSLVADFVTDTELSAALETVTSSLQAQIDTKLDTGSYEIDSASFDTRINSKLDTSTFTTFSSSVDSRILTNASDITSLSSSVDTSLNQQQGQIDSLISVTGSYAVTGSNTFDGNQVFSGSVQGELIPLTVTSQTASMDCSQGNFFTLTLPTGSNTNITATNIVPGLTITLEIKQPAVGTGNATFSTQTLSFPRLNQPAVTTQASAIDVATFVSFNSSKLNGVLSNDLV